MHTGKHKQTLYRHSACVLYEKYTRIRREKVKKNYYGRWKNMKMDFIRKPGHLPIVYMKERKRFDSYSIENGCSGQIERNEKKNIVNRKKL